MFILKTRWLETHRTGQLKIVWFWKQKQKQPCRFGMGRTWHQISFAMLEGAVCVGSWPRLLGHSFPFSHAENNNSCLACSTQHGLFHHPVSLPAATSWVSPVETERKMSAEVFSPELNTWECEESWIAPRRSIICMVLSVVSSPSLQQCNIWEFHLSIAKKESCPWMSSSWAADTHLVLKSKWAGVGMFGCLIFPSLLPKSASHTHGSNTHCSQEH